MLARLSILFLAVSVSPVHATSVWGTDASGFLTGSRTSPAGSGVDATEQWDNGGFEIAWDITNNMDGTWTYDYTVDVTNASQVKDPSHFILEVTDDGNPFDILGGTSTPYESPKTYSGSDSGNPGLPNSFYGVKFDFGSDDGTVEYSIVTNRAPVWGVFYAKDGKNGGGSGGGNDVIGYANALNFSDFRTNNSLTTTDFIVRPDGVTVIPVPAAVWLFGSGLLGLVGIARRRR